MKHTRFTTALVSVSALVAVSFLTAGPAKAAACSAYGGGNTSLACRQEATSCRNVSDQTATRPQVEGKCNSSSHQAAEDHTKCLLA